MKAIKLIFLIFIYFTLISKTNGNSILPVDSLYSTYYKYYVAYNNEGANIMLEKAIKLYKKEKNHVGLALANSLLARCYNQKKVKDTALLYNQIAEKIAKQYLISDHRVVGRIWNTYGLIYSKSDFNQASRFFQKSISLYKRLNEKEILCETYYQFAKTFYNYSNYDSASHYFYKALIPATQINNYRTTAYAYHYLSIIYNSKGNYQKAREYKFKALEIENEHKVYSKKSLVALYLGLAVDYQNKDFNLDEAYKYCKLAEQTAEEIETNSQYQYALIYEKLGGIFSLKQQYYKSINYYYKALDNVLAYDTSNYNKISSLYFNIGFVNFHLHNYDFAIISLNKAIEYGERMINPDIGEYYRFIGKCYYELKEYDKSLKNYKLSKDSFTKIYGFENTNLGLLFLNIGQLYLELKDETNAFDNLNTGYEILLKTVGIKNQFTAYYNSHLGDYYLKTDKPRKALENYQKALISLIQEFNDTNIYSNPDITFYKKNIDVYYYLKHKALAFNKLYKLSNNVEDLEYALDNWQLSIEMFQQLEIHSTLLEDKSEVLGAENNIFKEAIHTAYKLYSITEDHKFIEAAFKISEQGKAWLLQSITHTSEAQISADLPDSLINKEKELKNKYQHLKHELSSNEYTEDNIDSNDYIRNELFKVQKELDDLIDFIELEYPNYYNLKYSSNEVSIQTIQSKLGRSNAIVEFYIADSILYSFYIDNKRCLLRKIPALELITELNKFIKSFYNPDFSSNLMLNQDDIYFLNHIYQQLFKPFEAYFRKKNIIIIPDKEFSYLPFEIILTENYSSLKLKELPYLVKKNSVQYSYSAYILFNKKKKTKITDNQLIAFAPTYENVGTIKDSAIYALRETREFLTPIPYAKAEIANISKYFKSIIYTDYDASETNFKNDITRSNILHLAMHTIIDENNPMYSKLAFTLKADSMEDGLLNIYEIYNLNSTINLAVLSACKTGFGKLKKGEGVMSLARAFAYAGCPSVVMTLWSVEDKASSEVMTNFYKYSSKGKTKSESLRLAKLEYLKNADPVKAHPFFWAGYVQIGDSSPIYKRNYNILFGLIILLFVLSILYFYRKIKIIS